ncbi:hypothetical protein EGW08_011987 [Elysia chlorotica]|uniref:Uncharacterized protein n=1 Tax=Elysia chlorotica TaxID=188477 RepID=A0A3S1A1F2_ELYCH|nr:hypothetical protein EGW08_011987 [Elysia chlorotica]
MNYRATPHSATRVSPAEALMNRKIRTQVPVLESNLEPDSSLNQRITENDKVAKARSKQHYDKHHGATSLLSTLKPGNQVHLKDDKTNKWTTQGTVVAADPYNRTYLVNTPSGVIRRNRQHLLNTNNEKTEAEENPQSSVPEPNLTLSESPKAVYSTRSTTNNTDAPNIPNASYPPTSPIKMNTRSRSGFVAPKPARYKEEE